MHLYVIARGIQTAMDQWVNDVSAIFLPIEYEKGKMGKVRVAVRPIQLYEIVFPEEQKEFILGAIPDTTGINRKANRWFNPFTTVLRKFLKVEEVKPVKNNGAIINPYVGIAHIGIKKDEKDKDGIELL